MGKAPALVPLKLPLGVTWEGLWQLAPVWLWHQFSCTAALI